MNTIRKGIFLGVLLASSMESVIQAESGDNDLDALCATVAIIYLAAGTYKAYSYWKTPAESLKIDTKKDEANEQLVHSMSDGKSWLNEEGVLRPSGYNEGDVVTEEQPEKNVQKALPRHEVDKASDAMNRRESRLVRSLQDFEKEEFSYNDAGFPIKGAKRN